MDKINAGQTGDYRSVRHYAKKQTMRIYNKENFLKVSSIILQKYRVLTSYVNHLLYLYDDLFYGPSQLPALAIGGSRLKLLIDYPAPAA